MEKVLKEQNQKTIAQILQMLSVTVEVQDLTSPS